MSYSQCPAFSLSSLPLTTPGLESNPGGSWLTMPHQGACVREWEVRKEGWRKWPELFLLLKSCQKAQFFIF